MLLTSGFWKDALTRGIRTFCQTLLSVLGGSALNVWSVGWHNAFGVAAGSALLSVLMTVDRLSVSAGEVVDVKAAAAPVRGAETTTTVTTCGDAF